MRLQLPLFTRILLWFFLNLIALGAVLLIFFNLQFRLRPESPLVGDSGNQVETIARLMVVEMYGKSRAERDAILRRYSERRGVSFLLYENTGERLAGEGADPPAEALRAIDPGGQFLPPGATTAENRPPLEDRPLEGSPEGRPWPPPDRGPLAHPIFTLKTHNPTRYWMGVRVPFYDRDRAETLRATLLVASDSMTGHGLYFNPRPWLLAVTLVLALSILLWLPFVRNITRSIEQMTAAAERIAEERFDVRVDDRRGDELGRLGKAINHLAARLSGFVGGQKRFLGDISHELNSPLGRMQVALGILEERVEPAQLAYVADAREEVVLMSRLIEELIAYAKAGMKASEIQLTRVNLRQLAERVIECEAASATIHLRIDQMIDVLAQPDLLTRALANVIRNAVRYSQAAGPVTVTAKRQGDLVNLAVTDCGEGPPEESLSKIFDPFYRIEPDRSRQTGGVGLGLAIVKSCVESCQGAVSARKLAPSGFEISFSLRAAS